MAVVDDRDFPIQEVGMIPWSVAERAYVTYSALYGTEQSLQRLAERGGFALGELGFLLRGYEQRIDKDPIDVLRACEFATREILKAIAQRVTTVRL